jgi:hypothetical protein
MSRYRHNHYVPVWYQKRFMLPGQHKYYRLDLTPETLQSGNVKYTRKALHHWGPDRIFAEDDLYTTRWGNISNTEIERFFFGHLDNEGQNAVEYFSNFQHPSADGDAFNQLLPHMSVQKLRNAQGLGGIRGCSQKHKPKCDAGTSTADAKYVLRDMDGVRMANCRRKQVADEVHYLGSSCHGLQQSRSRLARGPALSRVPL